MINYKSQELAIQKNWSLNRLVHEDLKTIYPLDSLDKSCDIAIIKIPKSTDLFELYINQLMQALHNGSVVICGFMTRNFSNNALQTAQKYFEEVEQTKARKKARLMILKSPKTQITQNLIHEIKTDKAAILKQYYGVFSASRIDFATQFLLNHLTIDSNENKILDLGCGNGILAYVAHQQNPKAEIHLIDDHYLAIESAKLNLGSSNNIHYHFSDNLNLFSDNYFDLVISNPPFHFEYENNIEITLELFMEVYRILKPNGKFKMVANLHLNYQVHLSRYFYSVEIMKQNEKFVTYKCIK